MNVAGLLKDYLNLFSYEDVYPRVCILWCLYLAHTSSRTSSHALIYDSTRLILIGLGNVQYDIALLGDSPSPLSHTFHTFFPISIYIFHNFAYFFQTSHPIRCDIIFERSLILKASFLVSHLLSTSSRFLIVVVHSYSFSFFKLLHCM